MIQIWYSNIDDFSEGAYREELSRFPEIIRQEIEKPQSIQERKLKLMGRMLVQHYEISEGRDFSWKNWRYGSFGKPNLEGDTYFNISHSGSIVGVAFAEDELGLDIEQHASVEVNKISKFLHPLEREFIEKSDDQISSLFYVWTRKEAFLKAIGTGLQERLTETNCLGHTVRRDETWLIQSERIMTDYWLAVCFQKMRELEIKEVKYPFQ